MEKYIEKEHYKFNFDKIIVEVNIKDEIYENYGIEDLKKTMIEEIVSEYGDMVIDDVAVDVDDRTFRLEGKLPYIFNKKLNLKQFIIIEDHDFKIYKSFCGIDCVLTTLKNGKNIGFVELGDEYIDVVVGDINKNEI